MLRARRYALRAIFVVYLVVFLAMAGILLPWVWPSSSTVEVPDNGWVNFARTIEDARDSPAGYTRAYGRLCDALKSRVSLGEFVRTRGRALLPFLPFETWQGFGARNIGKETVQISVKVFSGGTANQLLMKFERQGGRGRLSGPIRRRRLDRRRVMRSTQILEPFVPHTYIHTDIRWAIGFDA